MSVPEVLFVCVHNAGRSQMAAAFLRHHGGGRPAGEIRPVRDEIERRVQDLLSELAGISATAGRAASDTGTAATVSAPSTRNAVE